MAAASSPGLRAAILVAAALPSASALQQLEEVRFWSSDGATRVAIELSAEVPHESRTLDNPKRVFIDLLGVRLTGRLAFTIPVNDSRVRQIRVAQTQDAVARVVLDLLGEVDYSISTLSSPTRLILEVRDKNAPRQAAPGAPPQAAPAVEPPASKPVSSAPPKQPPRPFEAPPSRTPFPAPVSAADLGEPPPEVTSRQGVERVPPQFAKVAKPQPPRIQAHIEPSRPAEPPKERSEPERGAVAVAVSEARSDSTLEDRVALPAKRDGRGEQSLTRTLGLKLQRVILDAGHGGKDVGTIGVKGLYEKDVVLDIALRLGQLIESKLGAEVVYTRKDDRFIPLEERPAIANRSKADLFLSIHANSSPFKNVVGAETYYLSFSETDWEREVATRENAGAETPIHDLPQLVRKITMNEKAAESRDLAERVQAATHGLAAKTHGRLRDRGVRKAPFVVLIGAAMPSVLAEIGFLTNAKEESLLRKGSHRQKIAEALYQGLLQYYQTLSHFRVAARRTAAASGQE